MGHTGKDRAEHFRLYRTDQSAHWAVPRKSNQFLRRAEALSADDHRHGYLEGIWV